MKCLHCNEELSGRSKKYCNNVCQGEWEYHNVHLPLILEGQKGEWSRPLRRYICERDNHQCQVCGLGTTWNEKDLTLQMDHIDGDSDNNHPDNLRLICPNCHTQTANHGSKGKGNRYKKITKRNLYLQEYKAGV